MEICSYIADVGNNLEQFFLRSINYQPIAGNIRVFSMTDQKFRKVKLNLDSLADLKQMPNIPIVLPGDVVFVPTKKFTWRKFMNVMRDVTIFATLYVILTRDRI